MPFVTTISAFSKPVTTSEKVKVTEPLAPTDIWSWALSNSTVGAVLSSAMTSTNVLMASSV